MSYFYLYLSLSYFVYPLIMIDGQMNQCNSFPYKEGFKKIHEKICSTESSTTTNTCKFPTEEQLQEIIEKYDNIFSFQHFLDLPEIREKYSNITLRKYSSNSLNETKGQTDCVLKSKTLPHEAGVCPYHFVVQYRHNKIPNLRKQAICNCLHECHAVVVQVVNDNKHTCTQILKIAPILELNCIKKGTEMAYEINLAFEEVSVACECMLATDLKRDRK